MTVILVTAWWYSIECAVFVQPGMRIVSEDYTLTLLEQISLESESCLEVFLAAHEL